jgi:hypothetical protein
MTQTPIHDYAAEMVSYYNRHKNGQFKDLTPKDTVNEIVKNHGVPTNIQEEVIKLCVTSLRI